MDKNQELENLKGKTFTLGTWNSINNKKYILKSYKKSISTMILYTNLQTFNVLHSELPKFLKKIKISNEPIKKFIPKKETIMSNLPSNTEKVNLTIFEPTEIQKKTQQALSDMLDKVMSGEEGAIEKAKSVCDITNAMVNMEKSQIQLLQLATKKR